MNFHEGKSDNRRPSYFTVSLIWAIALTLIAMTREKLGYQSETVDKE
jgi:hypothetical protein